jgi:hypothetical protein
MEEINMKETRTKTNIPFSNSQAVMDQLQRIKARKTKRYNKLGQWVAAGRPGFRIEIVDMKAVLK